MDHITQLIKSSASTITQELEYLYLEIKIQFCHRNVGNAAPHTHTRAQGVLKYSVRHVKMHHRGAQLRRASCCPGRLEVDLVSRKSEHAGMEAMCGAFPPIAPACPANKLVSKC